MVLDLKGFSAWITVDGVELQQYGVEISPAGNKATCWIPSEAGKNFTINWKDSFRLHQIGGYVKLDGTPCGGNTVGPAPLQAVPTPVTIQKSSVQTSMMTERPFLFSPLEMTDDDSYLDHQGASNLGEIAIDIYRVAILSTTEPKAVELGDDQKVHERSKKALAHRVKLGDDQFKVQKAPVKTAIIGSAPLAQFVFKYRSLDMLRANGIAPAAKKQKRKAELEDVKPDVIDIEDNNADEIRALEKRLDRLKSQRSSSSGGPSKKVKREPRIQVPLVPGEVIDLT